jgi:hypothetical protein
VKSAPVAVVGGGGGDGGGGGSMGLDFISSTSAIAAKIKGLPLVGALSGVSLSSI